MAHRAKPQWDYLVPLPEGRPLLRAGGQKTVAEAQSKIPKEWGNAFTNKKKEGVRWIDPKNGNNSIRIDKGDPNSGNISQRVDHVIINRGGVVIGRNGQPINGYIKQDAINAHVPKSDWLGWRDLFNK
ncbi:hypothetical protein [Rhizobium herbae]|uniref:Uncharacterized protein n=1 Tax=Rhizobium herbae TaxID=508661 RepID=A0ABS4EMC7_9HYPH|nr:hypothetical protein [Rhizobium herbae]MBP1859085.1 hypothetical protein [Rhizobium herbae]